MYKIFSLSILFFISLPALAVYKCESGDKVVYSDVACINGKPSDVDDKLGKPSASDVAKAKEQNAQEKKELKQLENTRHKREAQEEKQQQQFAKTAMSKQKKCAALEQKKKWNQEDVARATGKKLETAKRKSHQIEEKYRLECNK